MPPARRAPAALKVAGAVLAIGFLAYRMSPQVGTLVGRGSVGEQIPAISLTSIQGPRFSSDDLRGKVVLLNFWASWCGPCTYEMPGFQRVYQERRDSGFVVVGLWTNDRDVFAMREQLRAGGITYPIVVASPELVRELGGVVGLPTSLLVDRTGRIRRRVTGIFAEQRLRESVDELLAERPGREFGGRAPD